MKPELSELKAHLRIDSDDEDASLQGMIDAAYQAAAKYTRVDFETVYATELPAGVRVAVLMLAGAMYEHRDAVATVAMIEVPFGYKMLLAPFRNFSEE